MIETTTGLLVAPAISVSISHRPVIGSGITMRAGYRIWQGYSVLAKPRSGRALLWRSQGPGLAQEDAIFARTDMLRQRKLQRRPELVPARSVSVIIFIMIRPPP